MPRIHGISGSTQYLLNKTQPIQGKKLSNLKEIHQFYNDYENILADTEIKIRQQQDEIIAGLTNKELVLFLQLENGISERTKEVNGDIDEISNKIKTTNNFLRKLGYQFQYLLALSAKSYRINSPYSGVKNEIRKIDQRKKKVIREKQFLIKNECKNIIDSYNALKKNRSFFWGADGEELVIQELSQLPDSYHVLNDVNLYFNRPVYWKEKKEYIITSQIDHIVVGPTGIFLLETKNWKLSDISIKSDELIHQVNRSSLALWYYLKNYYWKNEMPKIRKVVVSVQGYVSNQKIDQYIDITTPYRLCGYITSREPILSENTIQNLIATIPWHN